MPKDPKSIKQILEDEELKSPDSLLAKLSKAHASPVELTKQSEWKKTPKLILP